MSSTRAVSLISGHEPVICAEIGSCHLGDKDRLFELSFASIKAGAGALKVQLFPNEPKYTTNNHVLPSKVFEQWVKAFHDKAFLGVTVFDLPYPSKEIMSKLAFIKVARSNARNIAYIEEMKQQQRLNPHIITVGSFDYMDCFSKERFMYDVALYCHAINGQTVYPVESILDWAQILSNTHVDGISDHSLNVEWTISRDFNISWMEKHVMLNGQARNSCGDARFALDMDDFEEYCEALRASL